MKTPPPSSTKGPSRSSDVKNPALPEAKIALPIDDFLSEIAELLKNSANIVLTAAPGAGKTTRLPPACLSSVPGQILVLEPRRMAAVAAATRIAEENGWTAGQEVGWQVRFDNRSSEETRLVFLTEALLARRLLRDPELKGVDLVILDEFHERSLHTDLALGLLRELQELGSAIKIIVMSATLQAEKISAYLGGAPIVSVPGRLFELDLRHTRTPLMLQTSPDFFDRVTEAVKAAQSESNKDILVFLPGVGEIERTRERLMGWAGEKGVELVPLHGSLTLEEQNRALRKTARQRVVLSTNIAESSVTVDGVATVIDTGLAKQSRFDLRTGFSRLELSRISLNSAIQRAGRAARQFPGTCWRLWNKQDESSMPKDEVPEIQRADLTEALLFLANQGVSDFRQFSWFEAPTPQALSSAEKILKNLGALEPAGGITRLGRELLNFPLPPRLGVMMKAAEDIGEVDLAARIAAILMERDFVRDDTARSHLGDRLECDLTLRLHLLNKLRPRSILQASEQIRRLGRNREGKASAGGIASDSEELTLRRLLLKAFPDRLCRRRGQTDRGLMVGGRGVRLGPGSLVKESEFFLALQGVEGLSDAETTVGLACGLDKEFVLSELGARVEKRSELFVDEKQGKIFLRGGRFYQDLPLEEPNLTPAPPDAIAEKLPQLLAQRFAEVLKRNEALARWWSRWEFLRRHDEEAAAIHWGPGDLQKIFTEAAYGEKSFESAAGKDLVYFFEAALPSPIARKLRDEVPDRLLVPSGSTHPVQYPEDKEPYLEVRLQEVFGWSETPKLLGTIPITLHLLGPNYRPVQVTSSLSSFWEKAYVEVRKELRARYPKHSWPDDPLTAKAEAKGRRRS